MAGAAETSGLTFMALLGQNWRARGVNGPAEGPVNPGSLTVGFSSNSPHLFSFLFC